jgi:outer membrane protein OmpA-like peptidoglycan-associated protein
VGSGPAEARLTRRKGKPKQRHRETCYKKFVSPALWKSITVYNPTLYPVTEVIIVMRVLLIFLFLLSACIINAQKKETLTIYFDFDKYELTGKAKKQVDSFFVNRQGIAVTRIELSGHCDFIGSDPYNDILSTRRVNKVKQLIKSYDLPDSNIVTSAYGEKKPLNQNRTATERQLNRRVEITIVKDEIAFVQDKLSQKDASLTKEPEVKLKEQIADTNTVTGSNIVLKNINFYGGMHRLLPESLPVLQELLDAMKSYPKLAIEIQGHICCETHTGDGLDIETGIYNLSAARARAIYDYLHASGIEPGRISFRGFGHSQPIYPYPERSEEEKTANRRVEIKIISK